MTRSIHKYFKSITKIMHLSNSLSTSSFSFRHKTVTILSVQTWFLLKHLQKYSKSRFQRQFDDNNILDGISTTALHRQRNIFCTRMRSVTIQQSRIACLTIVQYVYIYITGVFNFNIIFYVNVNYIYQVQFHLNNKNYVRQIESRTVR